MRLKYRLRPFVVVGNALTFPESFSSLSAVALARESGIAGPDTDMLICFVSFGFVLDRVINSALNKAPGGPFTVVVKSNGSDA